MKHAIVTGASSGIGWATSLALVEAGFRVIASGRDADRLAELAGHHEAIITSVADLSEPGACQQLVEDAVEHLGTLDLLVNNAGIYLRGDAAATTDEAWRMTLSINLDAPFYLSRACIPHLRQTRGSIINIASDWGLQGGRQAAAYCASKGGLVLLTRAMALDHAAEGIRVNAVCPGDVDTPMLGQEAASDGLSRAEALARYGAASPTGRVTYAHEVAALVCYLASPAAAQITGAAISIDGGNTA
jgi:NAD(P)-dependent dehydrogenase (short-subunit alcohol dehydrogenase family)